jgi:hypothetical protein
MRAEVSMIENQTRVQELEARAFEKDILALLSTNKEARIQNALVARNLRLEALRLTTVLK